jgi:hypothetical protein
MASSPDHSIDAGSTTRDFSPRLMDRAVVYGRGRFGCEAPIHYPTLVEISVLDIRLQILITDVEQHLAFRILRPAARNDGSRRTRIDNNVVVAGFVILRSAWLDAMAKNLSATRQFRIPSMPRGAVRSRNAGRSISDAISFCQSSRRPAARILSSAAGFSIPDR